MEAPGTTADTLLGIDVGTTGIKALLCRAADGAVLATAPTEQEGGTPERRLGFALGHWTELRRA